MNRNALFGNRPPQADAHGRSRAAASGSGGGGGGGGVSNHPDRCNEYQQAEDDEDFEAIKTRNPIHKTRVPLLDTRNAIRIASGLEEQSRNTLTRLSAQSDKLSGIERNLDASATHARIAQGKAHELKKLNRSMFAVYLSNPFNSRNRAEEEEPKIMERHEMEKEEENGIESTLMTLRNGRILY